MKRRTWCDSTGPERRYFKAKKGGCDVLNAGSATATREPGAVRGRDGQRGERNVVFRSPLLIAFNTFIVKW